MDSIATSPRLPSYDDIIQPISDVEIDDKEDFRDEEEDSNQEPNHGHAPQVVRKGWLALFEFTSQKQVVPLTFAISLSLISGLILPTTAVIFGDIFDQFARYGTGSISPEVFMKDVVRFSIGLTALGCIGWFTNGLFLSSWLWFGELQAASARQQVFKGLLSKEMAWFDVRKDDVSTITPRFQSQIREIQVATSQPLGIALKGFTTAFSALGVAVYYSWSLALVILAGTPIALLIISFLSARLQRSIKLQAQSLSAASKIASRAISAIDVVKAFNSQDQESNFYTKAILKAGEGYRGQVLNNAVQIGLIRFIVLSMFVQGFWYGSKLVREGESAGHVMATFWSSLMAAQAIEMILPNLLVLEKGKAASINLKATLKQQPLQPRTTSIKVDFREPHPLPSKCHGYIYLKDVCFSYPANPTILALNSITMSIGAGETIFVVGRSGSGKSSLGHLLLGVWQASSGKISIDEHPLKSLGERWLHDNVMLVQQQSVLFNESIHRNICFGRSNRHQEVDELAILNACTNFCLQEVFEKLPSGIDTVVGTGGMDLSGGERQRIALARARYRDSPILILDESTNALDGGTRLLVMENIRKWRKNKTTIIITHELSQIKDGDYVYVLESGQVAQCGTKSQIAREHHGIFAQLERMAMQIPTRRLSTIRHSSILEDEPKNDFCGSDSPSPLPQSFLSRRPQAALQLPSALSITGRQVQRASFVSVLPHASSSNTSQSGHAIEMFPMQPAVQHKTSTASLHYHRPESRRTSSVLVEVEPVELTLRQIFATLVPALNIRERLRLLVGFLAAAVNASCTPVFAYSLSKLFATMFVPYESAKDSTKWSLAVLAIATGDAITSAILHYMLECSGQSWVDTLRIRSFELILSQCREWFEHDSNKVSRLIEDLITNAEDMRNLLGRFAAYLFVGVFMMLIGIFWSFCESWELTMIGLAIAPVMYAIIRNFSNFSNRFEARSNKATEYTGTIFHETIMNFKTVRVLDLEQYFQQKYNMAIKNATRAGITRSLAAGVSFGFANSAIMFATALIFYFGAYLVSKREQSVQNTLAVISLLIFCLANANAIVTLIPQISNSKDTAHRLLRLSNLPSQTHENEGTGEVELDGFLAMHRVMPGECVAIVGPSGSGKSTLSSLLQRLYCPNNGIISLSGHPIQDLSTSSIRSQMTVVSQTPTLFSATVRTNILYGIPSDKRPSQNELESVAKAVGIQEWIESLPERYDTYLKSGDSSISGGQAQRISLARALIRRPKILLLDECTSALDSESASIVAETIKRLTAKRSGSAGSFCLGNTTVLIITHKQDMMRIADRVMVLDAGMIVETGLYEDLARHRSGRPTRMLSSENCHECESLELRD